MLTGRRRPPIACRNTNWQLVLDEGRLPSYETLRRFVRTEIALPAASVEGSAISFLDPASRETHHTSADPSEALSANPSPNAPNLQFLTLDHSNVTGNSKVPLIESHAIQGALKGLVSEPGAIARDQGIAVGLRA